MKNVPLIYYENERADLTIENPDDITKITSLCAALSSEIRVNMITQLQNGPLTVPQLAKRNFLSISATVHHVEVMERCGLINVQYSKSPHGEVRLCFRLLLNLNINLTYPNYPSQDNAITYTMGVGQFVSYEGCSILCFNTNEKLFNVSWGNAYMRERFDAQMLWATNGTVTYAFSSYFATQRKCKEISITFEICSEAPYFNHDWKSDITFWINGIELATYTCPGDYGNRRGFLNPEWWENGNTQYGELKMITVNDKGVLLDGVLVNDKVTLNDLRLADSPAVMFRLGNKDTAENIGGFNIFGKSFGDYPQDIVLTAKVEE